MTVISVLIPSSATAHFMRTSSAWEESFTTKVLAWSSVIFAEISVALIKGLVWAVVVVVVWSRWRSRRRQKSSFLIIKI
jgi:hypothetical protein